MKLKVVRTFADKCNYKMYAVGEIIELPDQRASLAIQKGLVESAEPKTETAVKVPRSAPKTATKKPVKRGLKKKEG